MGFVSCQEDNEKKHECDYFPNIVSDAMGNMEEMHATTARMQATMRELEKMLALCTDPSVKISARLLDVIEQLRTVEAANARLTAQTAQIEDSRKSHINELRHLRKENRTLRDKHDRITQSDDSFAMLLLDRSRPKDLAKHKPNA